MQGLIMLLMVPLLALNSLGGIVSGIWLAILGQWWAIGYGIAGVLSHFLLVCILMPGWFLFVAPAVILAKEGKFVLAFPLILLNLIYTHFVITAWCMFVFYVFISQATPDTFWPLLVWSYGCALGPWTYMASKELPGDASHISTFFAQIAYVSMVLVLIFSNSSTFMDLMVVFAGVMMVGILLQMGEAYASLR